MVNEYTALIREEDGWWIGWIEEIPGVNCQERSYEELLESLKVTLQEAIADETDPDETPTKVVIEGIQQKILGFFQGGI